MQNLSNNSNVGYRTANLSSIEHMQKYITELTLYINENNHKYNKNMQTLKEFYDEQLQAMQANKEEGEGEAGRLRNQLVTVKDLLVSSDRKLGEAEYQLRMAEESVQSTRSKLMSERRKIDELYQEMGAIRANCSEEVQISTRKALDLQQKNSMLRLQIKQQQSKIEKLTDRVYVLEDQLAERYSLPEKIQDVQKDYQKMKGAFEVTKKRCEQFEEKMDYQNVELQKYRKENQSLRIMKGKYAAEKNLQIQKVVTRERDNAENTIKKLQAQNQSFIYQINDCENRVKSLKAETAALESELKRQKSRYEQLSREMRSTTANKDAYISQFAQLKREYEEVIQRLEQSLIDYQKKNWAMEQENKELNDQLQALQELLNEVKAINNFQPARKQYRKLAELEILARKGQRRPEPAPSESRVNVPQSEMDGEWQRLMLQVQQIHV